MDMQDRIDALERYVAKLRQENQRLLDEIAAIMAKQSAERVKPRGTLKLPGKGSG